MVPLTPAAERAALRALTPPGNRMPALGPRGGRAPTCSSTRPAARSAPAGIGVTLPGLVGPVARGGCGGCAGGCWAENLPWSDAGARGEIRVLENLPGQEFPILAVHYEAGSCTFTEI